MPPDSQLTARALRRVFDSPEPLTVGLEEEVMLLQPDTLDLSPRGAELLARVEGDPRFKPELPAAQVEILTPPLPAPGPALAALATGRRELAAAADGLVRLAAAGAHPFAAAEGDLNPAGRYADTRRRYGRIARRQLVFALQVHVAVGGADRTLAVYNALRGHLPDLAALAANAPFHAGEDTGLASVRPKISEQLPRQGVPPVIESWERFAAELRWGAAAGSVPEPGVWWWELRPHAGFGTLEVRVPDAQAGIGDAGAIAAVTHALVAWLAERHDAGERLAAAPTWRIEENRWSAARHGVEGTMADLETGRVEPTRARLTHLLDALEPVAARHGSEDGIAHARALTELNGALAQRAAAARGDLRDVAAWLADRFAADVVAAPQATGSRSREPPGWTTCS
jgi:glutamate---cysteine ligase / carboxylate-amine ligase